MDSIIQQSYRYYNKAIDLIKVNNVSQAKIKLDKAIKLYGGDVQILNLLASCEYLLCDFNKANLYWNRSIKINNEDNKAIYYLHYLKSENFKLLLLKYNDAIKFVHEQNYKKAVSMSKEVINIDDNLIEPYYIIGLCLIKQGEYHKALNYIQIANKKDKGNLKYLECLNTIINNKQNYEKSSDKKIGKYKYVFISNVIIVALLGSTFTFILEKNNRNHESLIQSEIEKYSSISAELNKEKKSFNEIGLDLYEDLYRNSLDYYRNKNYKKAVNGFGYISENMERDNYLKSESIYLAALCYENMNNYDLAQSYYKLYLEQYPEGNYRDYSLYKIENLKNK